MDMIKNSQVGEHEERPDRPGGRGTADRVILPQLLGNCVHPSPKLSPQTLLGRRSIGTSGLSGIDGGIVPQVTLREQTKAFAGEGFHCQFRVLDHDRDRGLPGRQMNEWVGLLNIQFGLQ